VVILSEGEQLECQTVQTTADTSLMHRVSQGDEPAFAELYRRYNRKLLDFFFAMCRDPQVSEELAGDTFARIWHVRKRYAATGSFPAYLFSFARNIWLEHCRRSRKVWKLGAVADWADVESSLVALDAFRPDEAAACGELEGHIISALDALPEEQRMVFVMRVIHRMSLEDIAMVMQCPVNTVRSRKLLALKRLREALKELLAI
jgi:RNA polymerase sigma-70 factor (ECF subfamily)